jgi:hypothetical protein
LLASEPSALAQRKSRRARRANLMGRSSFVTDRRRMRLAGTRGVIAPGELVSTAEYTPRDLPAAKCHAIQLGCRQTPSLLSAVMSGPVGANKRQSDVAREHTAERLSVFSVRKAGRCCGSCRPLGWINSCAASKSTRHGIDADWTLGMRDRPCELRRRCARKVSLIGASLGTVDRFLATARRLEDVSTSSVGDADLSGRNPVSPSPGISGASKPRRPPFRLECGMNGSAPS